MPTFCRHGRMQANCPICSKSDAPAAPARAPRPARTRSATGRAPKAASGLRVRRVERAPEDGYEHWLVHGLRASADAARLADELAFSEARLAELTSEPPGLYAEVARYDDPDEAVWLAFLIAVIAPGRGGDPWSALEAGRVSWRSGELPSLGEPAVFTAYRMWAQRQGGQMVALVGDADWDPIRRFARTFERLTIGALERSPRFDFLVTLGALGVVALEAGTLAVGTKATDPVVLAAKRVTGIGDAITIERRLAELARGTGVPLAALDLALYNWSMPEDQRATMGARRAAAPERRAEIAAALGVV